jgi:cation-transporting ATPase I
MHLPDWIGGGQRRLEAKLRQVKGVHSAQANPLTGNVLICFDSAVTDAQTILAAVRALEPNTAEVQDERAPPLVQHERQGQTSRARIAVRGLDRDPDLARRVVERLERHSGVRVSASPVTGRVLVEFVHGEVILEDLIADVAELELPELPGENRPTHPLDLGPLVQSATRSVGAALGLGMLAVRRLAGLKNPPINATSPAVVAGIISTLEGFPATRNGLRHLLKPDVADLIFNVAGIVSLALAGSPLGLVIGGATALHLFTEIRARQSAWRRYEERLINTPWAQPGAVIRLEAGEKAPLAAKVLEGTGTAIGRDGLPMPVVPGIMLAAGAQLFAGPFVLELQADEAFLPQPRPAPVTASFYDRYIQAIGPLSLAYAAITALITRSVPRTFAALLLANPRAAVTGAEAANTGASERALRSGVTVVGTRPERFIRRPDILFLDSPRMLTDGYEIASVLPLIEAFDASEILRRAARVAAAAGSPWGSAFPATGSATASNGAFDGIAATAYLGGVRYSLGPIEASDSPHEMTSLNLESYWLALRSESEEGPLGILALRPRLAPGVAELVQICQHHRVEIGLLSLGDSIPTQALAHRAKIPLLFHGDALEVIRSRQQAGAVVAYASDSAHAAAAFAACDLAIGVTPGHSHFPARADLLVPDFDAVAAIITAGARREATVRDSVALSALANSVGAMWGFRGEPGVERASYPINIATLAALGVGWARMRSGRQLRSSASRLVDPHPERWGRRSMASVLRALDTAEEGLTSAQAKERQRAAQPNTRRGGLLSAVLDQIWSPLTGVLAAGAGLSFSLGAIDDAAMIGLMIVANAAAGVWQERRVNQAAAALERMITVTARVVRDGRTVELPANEVVPGDMLMLAPGDRVAADARLLSDNGLEVDEAALTGESLPVPKAAAGPTDASRVVLEGSAVTVGTGRAVVIAVGRDTRMGAIAAALDNEEASPSALSARLNLLLRQVLPLIATAGAVVTASGLLRRQPLLPQLAMGASIAVAAVPEGLPILAKVGEAAVARRLAKRHALVRHLSAVEGLGRVDVACTDKTGTLTEGRLALRLVADIDQEAPLPAELPASLHHVLLTAAHAGPHPDALDAALDPTDVAVFRAAEDAGLGTELRVEREAEYPFDSARSFHASIVGGRFCAEGAAEALVPRCKHVRRNGGDCLLDEAGQQELLTRAKRLAERGLRVLMVAEGSPDTQIDNPHGLVALGFLGISDPLRSTVRAAVRRCHDAGVRVIMLTGDHPATARAIADEAGLLKHHDDVLTGAEMADLHNDELDRRLEHATVIARATPLDKLRIVERLQHLGHTVAMTGDGVNDAPALRLADIGVAMGRGGTEVARQAADVVLTDDDFSTLVETFVEGRGFWRNIRRALGLLLGGNLGELGLEVGASVLGLASPLTTRQILAMNLITDVLPAIAVALQQPEHRNLAALAREGESALDAPLRKDIFRRATATATPTLAAYLIALRSGSIPMARTVAFASIITTQLAQTLDVGWAEEGLSKSVLGAVVGSLGLLLATFTIRPLRDFLGLVVPSPLAWTLIGAGTLIALLLGRLRSIPSLVPDLGPALPPPASS